MKRLAVLLALTLAAVAAAWTEVEFLGLDLGKDDRLLFAARAGLPGGGSYDSLFSAELGSGIVEQLTVYPEHVTLVDGGRRLQVQNRFGLFRTDASLANLAPIQGYPAFARGAAIPAGRLLPASPSPDGTYVLSAEPISPAYCRLVLLESSTGQVTTVAEGLEYSVETFPARWSDDSRYFVYAKRGALYYYSVEQLAGRRVLDEEYRRVGEGTIGSVRWSRDGSLYYLRGSSLYRILPAEFFTQALYRGLAGMGVLAGKTPFVYDPSFDDFWVASDGSRIILSKGGRNLFLVYLDPDDFGAEQRVAALPYLFLQGGTTVREVLWPANGDVTVVTGSIRGGERKAGAFRIATPVDSADLDLAPAVRELDVTGALELVLSPDEASVAIVRDEGILVRDYESWGKKREIAAPGSLRALWLESDRLVAAGSRRIEAVDLASGARKLIALSQAEAFGRDAAGALLAKTGGAAFKRPAPGQGGGTAAGSWAEAASYEAKPAQASSEAYRVYLEAAAPGQYRNAVMVRAVKALGTRPLLAAPSAAYAPFPERDEPRSGAVFDHGSRIRRREIALTFDALDGAEGLVAVLNALKDFRLTASFFVNGEFVRRNPGAARLLAESGHEIGSLFFTTVDPTDARFRVDRDYVRRGLARAEDDWFGATGKELSLLWHTPYYTVNGDILEAGASMSYAYVGRDMDPLDWVSKTDGFRLPGSYLPSHDIVERILKTVKPGSIVPIRLGVPEGGRDDYLYGNLALLVDALIGAGYAIVPVSTLIEHAE
ncbi:MAG: polysaccharide deacetylase family protein [Spirochaetaceae bacterium]|nr:polysaccharide deacetylase family protein [Spirochaetaceae bacterium]